MTEATFAVLALVILAWAVTSRLLAGVNVNGPLVLLVAGYALGNPDWGPLPVDLETASIHLLAEVTLALLLFADASRVDLAGLRRDVLFPARLLVLGLPLSILLGSLLAAWLLGDLTWALAGFVGATLAPTDAALSAQVVNDERIPLRVRRTLNVESGLNDGIVTPVVVFTIAVAAGQLGVAGSGTASGGGALLDLATGVATGLGIGWGSATLLSSASRRGWVATGGRRVATLAAALGSFATAGALEGNGFIAAFVAGIAFGGALDEQVVDGRRSETLPELLGEVLGLAVWFAFGAALVPVALEQAHPRMVLYALLSLTAVRLLPVGLALLGAGLDRRTVLFVGWFGPRGLASVVFALLAVEELGEDPAVLSAVGAVSVTVLLSVVLHGVSAGPLGTRYARTAATASPHPR